MPSHARAFDVRAHAVFGGDAFESESESPRRTWQVFADDLVDVTQGVSSGGVSAGDSFARIGARSGDPYLRGGGTGDFLLCLPSSVRLRATSRT